MLLGTPLQVLNLHGEVPSDADKNICVLNAEEHFLKHLQQLHKDFPKLRIVLEHATTKAGTWPHGWATRVQCGAYALCPLFVCCGLRLA